MCRICGPVGFEDSLWLWLNGGWQQREGTASLSRRLSVTRVWARLAGFAVDSAYSLSMRFDFSALRAWGSWQGKLFSNNGFKKQSCWRSDVSSGSSRQAERQGGRGWDAAVERARWLGAGGAGSGLSSASHCLALWPWADALPSLGCSFPSVL